jgi:hypothetical protein
MIPITAGMTGAEFLTAINNEEKEYNVKDYGDFVAGAVSEAISITNTETFQAALLAIQTSGSGKLYIPNGHYFLGGPLQTSINSTNPNCQIYIPLSAITENGCHITIEGESAPNYRYIAITGGIINSTGGVILESTIAGSGTLPAVFGTPNSESNTMNYTYVTFKNITIRTTTNTGATHIAGTMSGINFENLSNFQFDQLAIETTSPTGSMVDQTNATYGIILPKQLNYAFTVGGTARILGYKYGIAVGEHANINQLYIAYCRTGLVTKTAYQHGVNINCLSIEECKYHIELIAEGNIFASTFHSEWHTGSAWTSLEQQVYVNGATTRSVYFNHVNVGTWGSVGANTYDFLTNDVNRTSFRYLNGRDTLLDMVTLVTTNTWKATLHKRAKIVLGADSTLTINNAKTGEMLELLVIQDGTGGWDLTINSISVTVNLGASAATLVKCTYDGSDWRFF